MIKNCMRAEVPSLRDQKRTGRRRLGMIIEIFGGEKKVEEGGWNEMLAYRNDEGIK